VPLPERFTVMLYVPRTRSDFYGRHAFEQLMRRLAGKPVRFLVVGGGSVEVPERADVENLGWLDSLDGVYEQTTALIRFTKRDGLSLMVLEALSFGRHVLWTQQFPNVRHITDYDDIERHVLELLHAHERGELRPQYDASRLVDERYNSAECTRTIVRAWEDALHTRTPARLAVEGT
jgi:glycosyltransferase involved in cell wall biosynthesis